MSKMKMLLINGFSANMLKPGHHVRMEWKPIPIEKATSLYKTDAFRSVVGHADTAAVFADLLGAPVPCNRETVMVDGGAEFILGSYRGPRLPEGAHTLPEGGSIDWYRIIVMPVETHGADQDEIPIGTFHQT